MTETEETIRYLDKLALYNKNNYTHGKYFDNGKPHWYLPGPGLFVCLDGDRFYFRGSPKHHVTGFEMLEILAASETIAAKLAEPME